MEKAVLIAISVTLAVLVLLAAIVIPCALLLPSGGPETIDVSTPLGSVRGLRKESGNGFAYDAFLAIPYAQSPPMRFAKPQPKRAWSETWDATHTQDACATPEKPVQGHRGNSEDCLYLKILRPANATSNARLPVLFWIHGGNFLGGSSNDYDVDVQADHFVSAGLIIAQPSTRIGAFGYFTTNSPDAPGNYGAWDASQALLWTKANIGAFGGDPNSITLMGQSGGAILASLITLSPNGARYGRDYHRAILLAGSMFQPQVSIRRSVSVERNQRFAAAAGCDDAQFSRWRQGSFASIVACLRQLNYQQILTAMKAGNVSSTLSWHPTSNDGAGGLLPSDLGSLARNRPNIPVLLGSNGDAYSWDSFVRPAIRSFASKTFGFRPPPNFDNYTNTRLGAFGTCDAMVSSDNFRPDRLDTVRQACYAQFADSAKPTWFGSVVRAGSSFRYQMPIVREALAYQANGNPNIFLYSFDYVRSSSKRHADWWRLAGAFGNLELAFLENFVIGYTFTPVEADRYITNVSSHALTNFVRFGDPNGRAARFWRPVDSSDQLNFLSIRAPVSMDTGYHAVDVSFWLNQRTDGS